MLCQQLFESNNGPFGYKSQGQFYEKPRFQRKKRKAHIQLTRQEYEHSNEKNELRKKELQPTEQESKNEPMVNGMIFPFDHSLIASAKHENELLYAADMLSKDAPKCIHNEQCIGKEKTSKNKLLIQDKNGSLTDGFVLLPYMSQEELEGWKSRKIKPKKPMPCLLCIRKSQVVQLVNEPLLLSSQNGEESTMNTNTCYLYCQVDCEDGYNSTHVFWVDGKRAIVKPSFCELFWVRDEQGKWFIDQSSLTFLDN